MEELKGVAILWANSWWDGPKTGIASRGDRHYWFEAVFDTAEDEYEYPRRLLLYEITDQELQGETERHKRFEETVGKTRHCFHLPPEERHGPTQPVEEWARFYEDERNTRSLRYENRPTVGWFLPGGGRRPMEIVYTSWPDTPYVHLERVREGRTICGLQPGGFWTSDNEPGNGPICPECEHSRE